MNERRERGPGRESVVYRLHQVKTYIVRVCGTTAKQGKNKNKNTNKKKEQVVNTLHITGRILPRRCCGSGPQDSKKEENESQRPDEPLMLLSQPEPLSLHLFIYFLFLHFFLNMDSEFEYELRLISFFYLIGRPIKFLLR